MPEPIRKTHHLKIVGAVPLSGLKFEDKEHPNRSRCQVMPCNVTYHHPFWGEISFDEKFLKSVCDNFKKRKTAMVVDYNHGSLSEGPENTLAAGWIAELMDEGDMGLFALVDWTDRAAEYIRSGEFKYISPEFTDDYYDKLTGEFEGPALLAIALTNRPFLDMEPIEVPSEQMKKAANEAVFAFKEVERPKKEKKMLKKLIEVLKLKEDATEESALADIVSLQERGKLADGLAEEIKKKDAEIEAAKKLKDEAEAKILTLESEKQAVRANEAVDKLVREGKLFPVKKEWAMALFLKDEASFNEFAKDLPVVVKLGAAAGTAATPPEPENPEAALLARAKAIQIEKKISFNQAIDIIRVENPEMYDAYQKHAFKKSAKSA